VWNMCVFVFFGCLNGNSITNEIFCVGYRV